MARKRVDDNEEYTQHVYLMLASNGMHKVGVSIHPEERRAEIRKCIPCEIALLKTVKFGPCTKRAGMFLERAVFKRFKGRRTRFELCKQSKTEWFHLTPEDVKNFEATVREEEKRIFSTDDPKPPRKRSADPGYDAYREEQAERSRKRSAAGREVGPLPAVVSPERRGACRQSLRLFCSTYFPARFTWPFAESHLAAIERMEQCSRAGGLFALALPRGAGKALAIDTPIPTPGGWATMGSLAVGDQVYDETGQPCTVTFATDVMTERKCYRVTFDDRESVVCDADHLWTVNARYVRTGPMTLRTEDMVPRVVISTQRGWPEHRYSIPICKPIKGERTIVSIEPTESVPVRCIQVDSPNSLYLCGRGMVPTHNTVIAECAVLWSILYGLRKFVVLIQATNPLAVRSLKKIQRELETNPLLLEDFPEACHCVRAMERNAVRARMQTLDGVPTMMEWTAEGVVLPTIPGSLSAGAVLHVVGIEGAVRGLSMSGPDGEILRPDMVLIDDAQTRSSAKSPTQTNDREAVITDDVLGLAGPGTAISALMLCTVVYPADLSDRFLSAEKHAEWQGIRTKMLEQFPTRMDLWDEYSEVRRESFGSGDEGRRANDFLKENWDAMHEGAKVSWPERMKTGELSGVQSAMNIFLTNPRGFAAEYQNSPEPIDVAAAKELQPELVAARLSGVPRFEVPREANRLVCMIDVGLNCLWYAVVAWDSSFGGSVVDYGPWPRQARLFFAASDARPKLMEQYPGLSPTQAIYRGLSDLTAEVLGRTYFREGTGEAIQIERCLIDCGYEAQTVHQFCRQSPHSGTIHASKGIGRTLTARGVSEWKPRPGEKSGYHWRLTMSESKSRMVQFDPDSWKTALFERLSTAPGGRGCLTFYGKSAVVHEMIAHHCAAETAEPVTVRGLTFDKWTIRPDRPDNHLWDVLIGCCVAVSVQGLVWSASAEPAPDRPKKQTVSWAEQQRQAKARREGRTA